MEIREFQKPTGQPSELWLADYFIEPTFRATLASCIPRSLCQRIYCSGSTGLKPPHCSRCQQHSLGRIVNPEAVGMRAEARSYITTVSGPK